MAVTKINRARALRRDMSLPEVLLWGVLRTRPGSLKFRRQHPLGPYILDFFCREAGLAIEIDGEAHNRGDRPERDIARDMELQGVGIKTLRIPATKVLTDIDAVIRHVVDQTAARMLLHHPATPGGPPPRGKLGED